MSRALLLVAMALALGGCKRATPKGAGKWSAGRSFLRHWAFPEKCPDDPPPTASVAGHVTWETGGPAAGANVRIYQFAPPFPFPRDSFRPVTKTSADGSYRFELLDAGPTAVAAARTPSREAVRGSTAIFALTPGERRTVDLRLPARAQSVSGTVTDPGGQPVQATVTAVLDAAPWAQLWGSIQASSSADGRFEIADLGTGPFEIVATSDDYPEESDAIARAVAPGAEGLALRMGPRGAVLEGEWPGGATDCATAFRGPRVWWWRGGVLPERPGVGPAEAPSRRLRYAGVRPGDYDLYAICKRGVATTHVGVAAGEHRRGIRLEWVVPGRVRFRALDDATGRPLPNTRASDPTSLLQSAPAADDGVVALAGLPPVQNLIHVGVGDQGLWHDWIQAHVAPGQMLDLGDVRLVRRHRACQHGWVGLVAHAQPGRAVVAWVLAGSPAANAGIQKGDTLVEIDGRSVQGLWSNGLGALIDGAPGERVTLTLERDGMRRVVTLERVARGPFDLAEPI